MTTEPHEYQVVSRLNAIKKRKNATCQSITTVYILMASSLQAHSLESKEWNGIQQLGSYASTLQQKLDARKSDEVYCGYFHCVL